MKLLLLKLSDRYKSRSRIHHCGRSSSLRFFLWLGSTGSLALSEQGFEGFVFSINGRKTTVAPAKHSAAICMPLFSVGKTLPSRIASFFFGELFHDTAVASEAQVGQENGHWSIPNTTTASAHGRSFSLTSVAAFGHEDGGFLEGCFFFVELSHASVQALAGEVASFVLDNVGLAGLSHQWRRIRNLWDNIHTAQARRPSAGQLFAQRFSLGRSIQVSGALVGRHAAANAGNAVVAALFREVFTPASFAGIFPVGSSSRSSSTGSLDAKGDIGAGSIWCWALLGGGNLVEPSGVLHDKVSFTAVVARIEGKSPCWKQKTCPMIGKQNPGIDWRACCSPPADSFGSWNHCVIVACGLFG